MANNQNHQDEITIEEDDLMCPITLTLLEDPIVAPCCGRGFSRESLKACFNNVPEEDRSCPSCKKSLEFFNVDGAPKSVNLNYLIEKFKNENPGKLINKKIVNDKDDGWNVEINIVPQKRQGAKTMIGKLNVSNKNKQFNFKTLFVPVVDTSGSMCGSPIKQVIYSLNRAIDATYQNTHLKTIIIKYSDTASSLEVNSNNPDTYYRGKVNEFDKNMGGTYFKSAFKELGNICENNKNDDQISSLVVIFMTDGQDASYGDERKNLVKVLKDIINKSWNKEFVIHTVGFGNGHDFDLLNNMRMIGTCEGAYKFADPNESNDILSAKINSLLDVVVATSAVPISIDKISVPIINQSKGTAWIDLTNNDNNNDDNTVQVTINVGTTDNTKKYDIQATPILGNEKIADEWDSYLIDQIIAEIDMENKRPDSLDKQIHLSLIQQRIRMINLYLDSTSNNYERLQGVSEALKTIMDGKEFNQMRLNDMLFEGKYKTTKTDFSQKQGEAMRSSYYIAGPPQPKPVPKNPWVTLGKLRATYRLGKKNKNGEIPEIFKLIRTGPNNKTIEWIQNNPSEVQKLDHHGANILIHTSTMKRVVLLKYLLDLKIFDINATRNDKYNALDLAAIHGNWKSFDALYQAGAKLTVDPELVLRTNLSNSHMNTALLLVKYKLVQVTDDIINDAPSTRITEWLSKYSATEISVETAIRKGIVDIVRDNIDKIGKLSFKDYPNLLEKQKDDDYYEVLNILLENGKFDINETLETTIDGIPDITWPHYIVCEKGNDRAYNILMKYIDLGTINRQNNQGTTALWIAVCNLRLDIVMDLIEKGADPNVCNNKGDSPLIPACQKGSLSLVELLITAGCDWKNYNKERCNPFLVCCLLGQAEILDYLFNSVSQDEKELVLRSYAEIDGFVPLLSATEGDKVECIRVCVKHGANLEVRTADDNKIIQGATALHLACHYGRLAAARTLIELGADISKVTNVTKQNIMHIAIKQGHHDLVHYLFTLKQTADLLKEKDIENHTPAYYATMNGNEQLYEEFFVDKLGNLIRSSLFSNNETRLAVSNVISKYSGSYGICNASDTIQDTSLLAYAIMNGNNELEQALVTSGFSYDTQDNLGIPASFWKLYLQNSHLHVNERVAEMLQRVISTQNTPQNKLLTNLKIGIPTENDKMQALIPIQKMTSGYNQKVNNKILVTLRNKVNEKYSLVGFIEKFKTNKLVKSSEYSLWEAKRHMISTIALGEDILQPTHILALYLYSSNPHVFFAVNKTLCDWEKNEQWHQYIGTLYQAIHLLPPFVGEVYRGVDAIFDPNIYAIGNKLKWDTFTTASSEYTSALDLVNNKKGIVFIIKSHSGRSIKRYSSTPSDNEVIFLPESEFEITAHFMASITCLGQENIRHTTYGFTARNSESYMDKVLEGKNCIFIELQEIDHASNAFNKDNNKKNIEQERIIEL